MGAGTRMLAGCGCLAIIGAAALLATLAIGTWWLRDQAYDITDDLEAVVVRNHEIESWERRANAHPYEPPESGVVPEVRLEAFLDVRRRVHEVYVGYEDEIEHLRDRAEGQGPAPSPTELLSIGAQTAEMYGELRLALVKALAGNEMSEDEYAAIRTAVYVAAGAARAEEATGRLPAEALSDATGRLRAILRAAVETAREKGLPGSGEVSEEDVERLDRALSRVGTRGTETLAVPPENVALFRAHEEDLEKYAMHGLAVLGL